MSSNPPDFYDVARRTGPFAKLAVGEGRVHAIIGGPASGKSTLLQYLDDKFKQQNQQTLQQSREIRQGSVVVPVVIDLNETLLTPLKTIDNGLSWLLEKLCDCLKQQPYNVCAVFNMFEQFKPRTSELTQAFIEAFSQMLNTTVNHLGSNVEVRLVVLMDNVDGLADLDITQELFKSFYALFKDIRVRGFFDLILAGGDNLYDLLAGNTNWLNDTNILHLSSFEPAEAIAFLRAKTENQLLPHLCLLIYAYSGGCPFLLQHFIDELKADVGGAWNTVGADLILKVAANFPDHDSQGRIDIWRIQDRDKSQMTHAAYRLLIERCPAPETLVDHLSNQSPDVLPDPLSALAAAFGTDDQTEANNSTVLISLVDKVLAETGERPESGADEVTRLSLLRSEAPGLYNLLAFPFNGLDSSEFRKTLGTNSQGYSYRRALHKLVYMGAVQFIRQNYIILGQIFLEQFQEFSPKGKNPLIASLREQIQTLTQNLIILQTKKAQFGLDVPIHIINEIEATQRDLDQAHQQLAMFEEE